MDGSLPTGGVEPMRLDDPDLRTLIATADLPAALYIGLQAYVAPGAAVDAALVRLRNALTERIGPPVTLGYGPRFLHSTGQLHKGGPAGGMFIQIVDDPVTTVPVPETDYTFNGLVAAQAAGDRSALVERGRTVIPVDLGGATVEGIEELGRLIIDVAGD